MSQTPDQAALWLTKALYDCLATDHEFDQGNDDRTDAFFRTLTVVLGSEKVINDIDDIEHMTLDNLRSVMSFMRASKNSSLQEERISFILDIMQRATDHTINEANSTDSNKRKRTE